MEHKEKDFSLSWFFRWFLDNKAITVFLVTLLIGLNIFILSNIRFIFTPVCFTICSIPLSTGWKSARLIVWLELQLSLS